MTALPDWDTVSDAELAGAAAAGDRAAFASIYDRYANRLHDFCVGMLRDRDAAADCVQEVFCAAAVDLPKLRDPDKLRPWLYGIARHAALRAIRARRREHVSDELPDAPSGEPGPDALAARNELATLVAQAAGGLSDRDREVLELAYRHGLNGPDLAEALGVSHASAKKLVQRLRDTIERSLGALLVARRARTTQNGCVGLAASLQGWDGQFTVLMRKRIARHIESCSNCDEQRRSLVNPVALLGGVPVFIPAPNWLRDRTLDQVQLPSAGQSDSAGPADEVTEKLARTSAEAGEDQSGAGEHDSARHPFFTRRLALVAALLVGIPLAALGLTIAWQQSRDDPVAPSDLVGPVTQTTSTTPTGTPAPSLAPNSPPPQSISSTVPVTPPPPVEPATTTQAPPPPPPSTAPTTTPRTQAPAPKPVKSCPDGSTVPAGKACPEPPQTNCPDGSTVPAGETCPLQGLPPPQQQNKQPPIGIPLPGPANEPLEPSTHPVG